MAPARSALIAADIFLAYKNGPSAIRNAIGELGEVTNILHKLKSAGPHLSATLNEKLESALLECGETAFRLLKALRPYIDNERKKSTKTYLNRLKWAVVDSENIESILRSLLTQKRALKFVVAAVESLSPSAFTTGEAPVDETLTTTTTSEDFASLNILREDGSSHPPLDPDSLNEEDIEWIYSLVDLLETTTSNENQEVEIQSIGDAESVQDEVSFFHYSYPSSIARSDNASHIYSDTSSRLSVDSSIRSASFWSSTDTLRQSSGSLFRLPSLRRNMRSASSSSPSGSMVSLRSLMSRKRKPTTAVPRVPSMETLNSPTGGDPPPISDVQNEDPTDGT